MKALERWSYIIYERFFQRINRVEPRLKPSLCVIWEFFYLERKIFLNLFVGCSSREEISEDYKKIAEQIGNCFKGNHFIIGGTFVGMMGRVVKNISGDDITQIILKDYVEAGSTSSDNFIICDTSFERMNLIWNHTDVFLFLPGGTGTLGEIITFLEENRTKVEKKKIIVFNYQGYYDDIVAFVQKAKEQQFCNDDILAGLSFASNLDEVEKLVKG